MSEFRSPVPIGEVANPPFVHLPDPATHFRIRAQRFAVLSEGHELRPYLRFLAGLSEGQHRCQDGLPEPELPSADIMARAREYGMPPLDRATLTADPALDATFERLFALAPQIEDMPEPARQALDRVTRLDAAGRDILMRGVLADEAPVEALAEHAFVAAALQVHFARLAARLDAQALKPISDGVCPACGGPPIASMLVGWKGANNTRHCACSLCSTYWHVVRIKCVVCSSTKGIGYQEIEGGDGSVRAETCEECKSYVKIMQQVRHPDVDPYADDVASLGLDLKVRELGYRRGAVNPYLLGY